VAKEQLLRRHRGEVCRERGIVYQGVPLLTANQRELGEATAAAIARRLGATILQVVFRFAFAVGMVALTGTSDRTHMQQVLAAVDLAVTGARKASTAIGLSGG
jgi:diketogulonate reductase-like aldo/keto reductase